MTNAKEAILVRNINNGKITLTLQKKEKIAQLTVTDNGGGISEEVLPRLFDPYFSTKETGTGIGLYMSKMIIENSMNGQISVKNVPNGAEFSIITPCCTEQEL